MTNKPTNTAGSIARASQAQAMAAKPRTPAQMMNAVVCNEATQKMLAGMLKEKAGAFTASVIDLYNSDKTLQPCDPGAVFAECLKAVSLDLPINRGLGFAYILPYRDHGGAPVPQFQLGYKGYVQLAMRTGAYRYINAGPVYEGELVSCDKLTGAVDLSGARTGDAVIGYFAYIETLNGFSKALYWTREKVIEHAARYSKSYKAGSAVWKDNFEEMAVKTVLRYLLSHWGVLSVEMQNAFTAESVAGADALLQGDGGPAVTVEADAVEVSSDGQPAEEA